MRIPISLVRWLTVIRHEAVEPYGRQDESDRGEGEHGDRGHAAGNHFIRQVLLEGADAVDGLIGIDFSDLGYGSRPPGFRGERSARTTTVM